MSENIRYNCIVRSLNYFGMVLLKIVFIKQMLICFFKLIGIKYIFGVMLFLISFCYFSCKIREKDLILDERESCD